MRHVEVLEFRRAAWSLLILGDLDPYPALNPPNLSLPTATAKSPFAYDLQALSSDITSGRAAISALQRDVAALQAAGLAVPAGVDAAITAAQSAVTAATGTANGYVDQINSAVDTAYAVANATATGDCADQAIGAAPAHLQHIAG